jgi:hypothetical protein
MPLSIYVILATFIGPLFPVGAVTVNHPAPGAVAPHVVARAAGYRSFSGKVQTISDGRIRLRDDSLGDITVVITKETSISKNRDGTPSQAIRAGTRLHGYGSFRGGNYYAKVITID